MCEVIAHGLLHETIHSEKIRPYVRGKWPSNGRTATEHGNSELFIVEALYQKRLATLQLLFLPVPPQANSQNQK
jgi:hypothetical protein